jgi:hypothetical protein
MSSVLFPLGPETATSPNQALIGVASIAIWNKNKVLMAVTISLWGIEVVFLIQGKFSPQVFPPVDYSR